MIVDKKLLAATRRKLERAELKLLRQHIIELDARLEAAENRANNAEDMTEFWRDNALDLQEQQIAGDPAHRMSGLTKDGHLIVVDTRTAGHA
jgi:hypothetical protein